MERRLARADLRVGDAERQRVVAELQRHYVEGRLTTEELGERVSQALHARTFADFTPLLSDLPSLEEPNAVTDTGHPPGQDWHTQVMSPPIGAILLIIGLFALLWVLMTPGLHIGFFPWPLLIWGFFIFGRSHRGRHF
jgi:hypothetical protein